MATREPPPLGPRDPSVEHYYGAPRHGATCDACGRSTATYHAGIREVERPSGVIVTQSRRVCLACIRRVVDAPPATGDFDSRYVNRPPADDMPPSPPTPA